MFHNLTSARSRSVGKQSGMLVLIAALVAAVPANVRPQSPSALPGAAHSTCAACQNFYEYANKAWLDTASIPADRSDWGAFFVNAARVEDQLHGILLAAALPQSSRRSPSEQVLGMFNASCMDSASAESAGIGPLRPVLAGIDSIANPTDVARALGRLHRSGVPAVFLFDSDVDRVGDLRYIGKLSSARLTLSNPRDYLGSDSASIRRRAVYSTHVIRTFVLAGESPDEARRDAQGVLAIESALAKVAMSRVDEANATLQSMYRHSSMTALEAATPGFSWSAYLRERHAPVLRTLIVQQPEYFTAIAHLVTERPIVQWRAYLRWQLLSSASPSLSSAFVNESFHFSQASSGVKSLSPRWQRCVDEVSADLPELVGRAYAVHTFPPSSKAHIDTMVRQIRAVLVERLKVVPWLTEPTRRQALEKARTFGVKIGYPDKWHDYSSLRMTPGPFITQRAQALRFESDRLMTRIGQAPDRAEWDFHEYYHYVPQSPTAWANFNEIIFPAAYLQAPNYNSTADVATNYGAIGFIIAHEITHLFTADGGDIDGEGRIRHWWNPTDSVRFAVIQQGLVHQYDRYTVLDSNTHVNGTLTLGENLADVGGAELAYAALERALPAQRYREKSDTTPEMRFFLSYAHIRAAKSRPEALRRELEYDGHAPSIFRVNGPLSNFTPFAKAFACKPGDPMVRPDSVRIQIW